MPREPIGPSSSSLDVPINQAGVSVQIRTISPGVAGCWVAAAALVGAMVGQREAAASLWMGALGFLSGTVAAILWNALFIEPKSAEAAEPEDAEAQEAEESAEPDVAESEPEADEEDQGRQKAA